LNLFKITSKLSNFSNKWYNAFTPKNFPNRIMLVIWGAMAIKQDLASTKSYKPTSFLNSVERKLVCKISYKYPHGMKGYKDLTIFI
jgi:hypothetical protein